MVDQLYVGEVEVAVESSRIFVVVQDHGWRPPAVNRDCTVPDEELLAVSSDTVICHER